MTIEDFKECVKSGNALDSEEIHSFMDRMSNEARHITFLLNTAYRTPDEVRELLSELFGYKVPSWLRVFPPFYTDYGKNINIGEGVFINACCHFQDHGGVTIGDGCQIGHNVVFATLNHELEPERRRTTRPAPITLGKNVWIGSNATILPGVTIGDNAVGGRCCRYERCGIGYSCRRCSGEVNEDNIMLYENQNNPVYRIVNPDFEYPGSYPL